MAVWQFHFSMVPRDGIKKALGRLPSHLEEYQPVNPATYVEDREYPDYWAGIDRTGLLDQIGEILDEMKSWSAEARMFGSEEGDRVQVWEDDIHCDVDIRTFSLEYVRQLCELAEEWGLVLVLGEGGEVVDPDLNILLGKIKSSRALGFCVSPQDFLRNLAKQQREGGA